MHVTQKIGEKKAGPRVAGLDKVAWRKTDAARSFFLGQGTASASFPQESVARKSVVNLEG